MMRALLVLALLVGVASAQPSTAPSTDPAIALREANAAATAGDWARVSAIVESLLARQLERADLGEAHRLAGIAAMFAQPPSYTAADGHFLAYLRIDLDAHLDPALYPPEVVNRFNDVRARHSAELKALRPQVRKRYAVLAVLPPVAQFQNGDKAKGIVIGSLLGTFAIANVTTYLVLRSWCFEQEGPIGCRSDATAATSRRPITTALRRRCVRSTSQQVSGSSPPTCMACTTVSAATVERLASARCFRTPAHQTGRRLLACT